MADRVTIIIGELKGVFGELAGQDLSDADPRANFFELGFDSLLLTQASSLLKNRFGVKITFRQLLEDLNSLESVACHLAETMPAAEREVGSSLPNNHEPSPAVASQPVDSATTDQEGPVAEGEEVDLKDVESLRSDFNNGGLTSTVLERIMKEQLAVMTKQLEMLRASTPPKMQPKLGNGSSSSPEKPAPTSDRIGSGEEKAQVESKAFGPYRPINTSAATGLTDVQQKALDELMARYTRKTPGSKRHTQLHRKSFCDPRTVAGFRMAWKEMVYPIIAKRSQGARIWDVDGNEYIDVTMGFGTNLFGHNPSFIADAIEEQLHKGIEVGPQSPMAGKVTDLICELTGQERAAFCNTGSEAVHAAIRVARTVTGRSRIATTGGFHGICDEVLVRANVAGGKRTTVPVAPGIPDHVARDVLVLDYGSQESLELLRKHAHELAVVLVEPVQSRHPDLQPRDFLHEMRKITNDAETALLFDEVITGFRCDLGGAQAHFGVKADLATYGKIIGGGMPIGVIAGSSKYMDALDGGWWQYGDSSFPEVGVTFFAGTYVRHPLALAASYAALNYLKQKGNRLQEALTCKTKEFVEELNRFLKERNAPLHIEHFASLFYFHFNSDIKYGSLLWFYLREKGIHIWEGRPCFFSTAHTEEDIACVLQAFKESIVEMQDAGFLPGGPQAAPEKFESHRSGFEIQPAHFHQASSDRIDDVSTEASRVELENEVRPVSAVKGSAARRPIEFSIYFFGNYDAEYRNDKYKLIIEAARFADEHGFKAIWLPERHFHRVGGFSPNPSVLAAALALQTKNLQLRAGSVVLPLHHPVRVAEEWSEVDNLSDGRVGISIASGWHPNDFVFAPDAYEKRRELCWEGWDVICRLWRGETVEFPTGGKNMFPVRLYPLPKQSYLPAWLTCIHRDSYVKAGELGMGTLGYTMNTTLEELEDKIAAYRQAYASQGHDAAKSTVTILLHTFVGETVESARDIARKPMCDYLRSFLDNSRKRLQSQRGYAEVDEEDIVYLLNRAFEDYVKGRALIGSPDSCAEVVAHMQQMGVNEIGCFLDFGVDPKLVLENMEHLVELKRQFEVSVASPSEREEQSNACFTQQEERNVEGRNGTECLVCDREEKSGTGKGEYELPMPDTQKGLWTVSQLSSHASRSYNESMTLELRGSVNRDSLRKAFDQCIARHEALRSSVWRGGEAQWIHAAADLEIPFEDLSALSEKEKKEALDSLFEDFEGTVFDFGVAPVLKVMVIKLEEERHWLVLMFHHLFGNGPSYWKFLEDLCSFYEGACRDRTVELDPPKQLSDFIEWHARYDSSPEGGKAESFWLQQFAGELPQLELPGDRSRPPERTFRGARREMRLEKKLVAALRKAGGAHRCSLFVTLFSAFKVLLHRLSGQTDLVVGVPFESSLREQEYADGMFANTTNMTPLRSQVNWHTPVSQLMKETRDHVFECREHQDYFFGKLLPKLRIKPDLGRAPLFSVTFNYETGKFVRQVDGLEFELITGGVPYRNPRDTATFDLGMNIAEKDGELLCELDYSTDLFRPPTMDRWLEHYRTLLESIVAKPEESVGRLPLLTAEEKNNFVLMGQGAEQQNDRGRTVDGLIEAQAAQTPDAPAAEFEGRVLSYRELEELSNQLSVYLQRQGVEAGMLVGICMARSLEMLLAVLAVMKAGAAYIPIDPELPAHRIAFMVEDAAVPVLITDSTSCHLLPATGATVVSVDRDWKQIQKTNNHVRPEVRRDPDQPIYVIYTSGSTGKPKGVEVHHGAVVNFLESMKKEPGMGPEDILAAITTLSFDIAALELFLPLVVGAKVLILSKEVAIDPQRLMEQLDIGRVTILQATPATWRMLVEAGWKGAHDLKALCGGEAITRGLADDLINRCGEVWNMYGPTETTIWSAVRKLSRNEPITVGRPIANTRMYIVDDWFQLQPAGVPGELLIGGHGVAKGYRNREELTAEKFIPDPFQLQSMEKVYRTGDLAKYHENGEIEVLGRCDFQVKVRGHRVELGEIESVLESHPAVREAVVVARPDISKQTSLVGYVTAAKDKTKEQNSWKEVWELLFRNALEEGAAQSQQLERIDSVIFGWTRGGQKDRAAADRAVEEWIQTTVNRIEAIAPKGSKVLELGCGTGQILLRVAANYAEYWGTDVSASAIHALRKRVKKEAFHHVKLLEQAADVFDGIPENYFDSVILNSVTQYFPNTEYLVRVIEGMVRCVKPGGKVFVGDVQSHALMECFHTMRQLEQMPPNASIEKLRKSIAHHIENEDELMVDPQFFHTVRSSIPAIVHVQTMLRRGRSVNETTQFHYDTVLHIGETGEVWRVDEWKDWRVEGLDMGSLRNWLMETQRQVVAVRGMPNGRLSKEVVAMQRLRDGSASTVGELRGELEGLSMGIDPEDISELAENAGFEARLRWNGTGEEGLMDAVFFRAGKQEPCLVEWPEDAVQTQALREFANRPTIRSVATELVSELRSFLKSKLPDYMVPGGLVVLDQMPRTANHKVDRRALPASEVNVLSSTDSYLAPRTETEQKLATIWSQVLGLERVGITDDFFDLGGHSLFAVTVFARIERELGVRLPLAALFRSPTVEQLSLEIAATQESQQWSCVVPIRKTGSRAPFFCVHGAGGNVLLYRELAAQLGGERPFYGLQARGLDGKSSALTTIEEIANHYLEEIRKVQPYGPYHVGGYCMGGTVAYEIARRLYEEGEEMGLLALLDTYNFSKALETGTGKILRQKLQFHLKNLSGLRPGEMMKYMTEKFRVARDGELRSLFQSARMGSEGEDAAQASFHAESSIQVINDSAASTYQPRTYPGKVTVFRPHVNYSCYPDAKMGWGELALGGVEVVDLPFHPHAMLVKPYVSMLARELERRLAAAESLVGNEAAPQTKEV